MIGSPVSPLTKWFDDKEKAENFHELTEYSDKPVAHVYKSEKSIKEAEEYIRQQNEYDGW